MEMLFALRLSDLRIFAAVARHRSLVRPGTAELDGREPIALRASLARLEDAIGSTLFVGNDDHLELTAKAERVLPIIQGIIEHASRIELEDDAATPRERLTLSSPTFIAEVLLPHFARSSSLRSLRGLSVPPVLMSQYAEQGIIDAAITIGTELDRPMGWSSAHVGEVRYGLFASPSVARTLGPDPSVDDVRRHRFVAPVYMSRMGELIPGDDRCPLARRDRTIGHEVENMTLACRVAADTDHLVYGPVLAAAPFVASRFLTEVPVPGWSKSDALYLACDSASVRTHVQDELAGAVRNVLGPSPSRQSGIVQLDTFATRATHKLG
jgi:DNA-binding transcriptional LysR family regulator